MAVCYFTCVFFKSSKNGHLRKHAHIYTHIHTHINAGACVHVRVRTGNVHRVVAHLIEVEGLKTKMGRGRMPMGTKGQD